ncbi:putative toxin biosynthesis protein [Aspergillus lentulus]|nr:putative toxin biosynthesis protein [Aspergillus lentulus]GFG09974.1 putative toxin biosynthesis protein [Aspergillus lentulus]
MDLNSLSAWSIPLTQWLLVQLLTGWTIAFTQPYSKLRPAVTAIVIALAYSFQTQVRQTFAETRARGPLAAMCWVNVLNAIDLLVLSRASFDEQIAWKTKLSQSKSADSSYRRRLVWSVEMAFNYRRVNTPWQIRAVPAFDKHDPGFVPDKWDFLRRCAAKVCGSLLVLHFCTIDAGDARLAGMISEISDSKNVLLPTWEEWTARRALVQMLFTISFGFVTRAAILGTYSLLSMFFVAVGAYEPVDWPPVFGDLGDMYSLTRVWGIAWHQILRKLVTSNADFLLFDVLRLPQGFVARSLRLIMAFATSGLVHFLMDLGFGVSLDQSGALWFFCLQIPGIAFENLVWWTCHGMIKRMGYRWRKAIGYVWVILFFLWATPVWLNPIILRLYQDGQRIPSPFLGFKGVYSL